MKMRLLLPLPVALALGAGLLFAFSSFPSSAHEDTPPSEPSDREITFARDVRPILAGKCFTCHGPDEETREADLRLDIREQALGELPSGAHAIAPGDLDASELIRRILSDDEFERMPPDEIKKPLTEREKEVLQQWVKMGAPYDAHWAFVAPERPELPAVQNSDWAQTPIDRFVLERLERAQLKPAPEADRYTLIRRLHFDLLGLPPTLEEVNAFVNDPDPNAYEKLVDRVLASPRYGEKMAQIWLDLARFGDTNGYHQDSTRRIYPWRDWVINAYNDDMPFDRFTIEQLGGDLIPNATVEQRVASGFNRNTRYNEEGGADPDEFRVRYAIDRVNTFGQAWLGLTTGCAECHSHKYDPISHKEYYQFYAFFNSLDEPGSQGHNQKYPPLVKVPTEEQLQTMATAREKMSTVEEKLAAELAKVEYVDPGRDAVKQDLKLVERRDHIWIDDEVPADAELSDSWQWITAEDDAGPIHSGQRAMRRSGKGLHQHYFLMSSDKLRVGTDDKLFVHVWLDPADPPQTVMIQFHAEIEGSARDWEHRAVWGAREGFGKGNPGPGYHHLGELPKTGEWVRLEVDPRELGFAPGSLINGMAFSQFDGTVLWDSAGIHTNVAQGRIDHAWIDDDAPSGAKLQGEGNPAWNWVGGEGHQVYRGFRSMLRSGPGLHQHFFTDAEPLPLHAGDKLFAYVWLDPHDPPRTVQLQFNNGHGSWNHRAHWGANEAHGRGLQGGAFHRMGDLPKTGEWVRLEVDLATVGLKPGEQLNGWAFTQVGGKAYWDFAGVSTWHAPNNAHLHSQLVWEDRERAARGANLPANVRDAIMVAADARNEEQARAVRHYYLRHVYEGTRQQIGEMQARVSELEKLMADTEEAMPESMTSVELPQPRKAFVLLRGDFLTPGDEVTRGVPEFLPPMGDDLPRNRLGLAQWVASENHPLFARVAVNRLWAQCFGTGLVKTMGDFGTQGELPSHPELLDWLATEFARQGYSNKALLKQMVMSNAYRQSSSLGAIDAETRARGEAVDPDNRLLWRAPRYRVTAEELRDNALAIAGILDDRIGGPSVFPYQPQDYYAGKFNWAWDRSTGKDLYRRGLYTFWRRTTPYPTFMILDAPSREECTVERPRTNTPLAALVTLNDPQFFEAARVFGQRVLLEGPADTEGRLTFAFRTALARPPREVELTALRRIFERQLEHYTADPAAAEKLASAGEYERPQGISAVEHAAWTAVANLILNLDEAVSRE